MYGKLTICTVALLALLQLACARQGTRGDERGAAVRTDAVDSAGVRPVGQAPDAPGVPDYRFDAPTQVFELPGALKEISGLTVLDPQTLGAIQDEEGVLYFIDIATGTVRVERDFGKDRDYEGIERAGDALYVLRSDGTLYEIEDWQTDDADAKSIKTDLSRKYDTEGLAYDASRNRLLIACKEFAGKNLDDQKAIYAFDLATREVLKDPVYTIDIQAFNRQLKDKAINRRIRSFLEPVADLSGFKPSALGIHPVTGEVYVLSSVRKAVVVLNPGGEIVGVYGLPERLFAQPEGLAFLPNGDLFISNEGGNRGRATLLRFNYR